MLQCSKSNFQVFSMLFPGPDAGRQTVERAVDARPTGLVPGHAAFDPVAGAGPA